MSNSPPLNEVREEYLDVIAPDLVLYSQDIRNATEGGRTVFALDSPSKTAREVREVYLYTAREEDRREFKGDEAGERSEALRLALRLGLTEAAPEYVDTLREAVADHSTDNLQEFL